MMSHDVTSQGCRRTSALSTTASSILLNNVKHGFFLVCSMSVFVYLSIFFEQIFACICGSLCACVCVAPTYWELFTGEPHR